MNTPSKILFWTFTILLGFVNPLISVALIVLYYLPGILRDSSQTSNETQKTYEMNSFSEEVMEDMK